MFPTVYADLEQLNRKLSQQQNSVKPLGKSCFFDYKTGQHKIIDGKTVLCSFVETMEQFIPLMKQMTLEYLYINILEKKIFL